MHFLREEHHDRGGGHSQKLAGEFRHPSRADAKSGDIVAAPVQRIKERAAGIQGQAARIVGFADTKPGLDIAVVLVMRACLIPDRIRHYTTQVTWGVRGLR